MGLKALQRAAVKAFENAKRNNHKIHIWENGHINYEIPEINPEQFNTVDPKKQRT